MKDKFFSTPIKPISRMKMQILQDPNFQSGAKNLNDYLSISSIKEQLYPHDIDDLKLIEENIKIGKPLRQKIKEKLGHDVQGYLNLPIMEYKIVVPLLIEWIPKFTDWRSKEGIIRTLSTPYAKDLALEFFIDEFIKTPDAVQSHKWAIGNGLWVFANDDILDRLIPLAQDKKHGNGRQMIVLGLGKMKKPENKDKATEVLIGLLGDPDVTGHAIAALGKLKAKKAIVNIEPYLESKNTYYRNEAKKALKKINRT